MDFTDDGGHTLDTLFRLSRSVRNERISSADKTGGNMDWVDVLKGETLVFADIKGTGVVRHFWCAIWSRRADGSPDPSVMRAVTLRMFWDGEEAPSVETPLGDFFGIGHGIVKSFSSLPLTMGASQGRAFSCWFPMPFSDSARFELFNESEGDLSFYFYLDYERIPSLWADSGRFHAQFRRARDAKGWAPVEPGLLDREKAKLPGFPDWYPKAWTAVNTDGKGNYTILAAKGLGKYVGCHLDIDVHERQANDWYGEGDDMFFIDGEPWPPRLHGTGTEDYFNAAFCPKEEFCCPTHGITVYSGDEAGFPWGGKNSLYRYHIHDPIHFQKSIIFSIERGHANKLSNDYSSTAYWYQSEPHEAFPAYPALEERLPGRRKKSEII
jgi:hypothetical protein